MVNISDVTSEQQNRIILRLIILDDSKKIPLNGYINNKFFFSGLITLKYKTTGEN